MLILESTGPVVVETVIKKSRFIATAVGISAPEEFADFHAEIVAGAPGARHVCWAYTLGSGPHLVARSSDDGEPGGTAGPPILAALQSRQVANAAITVVRYFGGVKLGAGGLIRAYGGSANAVLDATLLRAAIATAVLTIEARSTTPADSRAPCMRSVPSARSTTRRAASVSCSRCPRTTKRWSGTGCCR
ncbi:YigZ family protein [Gordonia alkaliphila]|uniref:IMPACT family protein n=1 Tax=Gordonia alkaliphila TaxID=1053547 RepID=UPI001FF6A4FF|nr:YigZ family protein [Gordonia alkaliphila]MCK0440935.1 YigZ family protein [Gordonia alkaliphila]